MATIKEIADMTGLSINTVSRALRGAGYVSAHAAEKVRRAAESLNYHPNKAARQLRGKASNLIMVVAESNDFLNIEKIDAIQKSASERHYSTQIFFIDCHRHEADVAKSVEIIYADQPAGIILIGQSQKLLKKYLLLKKTFPIAVIGYEAVPDFDCAFIDRFGGVSDAVHYLYNHGRRRIAVLGLENPGLKYSGYLAAIRELNLPELFFAVPPFEDIPTLRKNCRAVIAEILSMAQKPDAIQCSDYYGAAMTVELMKQKIKVPEEIAVIGFDNRNFTEFCEPPLSTIAQPNREIGTAACKLLFERIKKGNPDDGIFRHLKLPMHLIIRKSC